MERFLCSVASLERAEAVVGTASQVSRWLLVEAPGAWGARSLPQSRDLDDDLLRQLQRRVRGERTRLLLIRKPGRPGGDGRREVYAADSRPGRRLLFRREVSHDSDLSELVLPFDGEAAGWEPRTALVAVCTHGRHDTCCAVFGRPVAAALAASHPELTYEVSHIGGDRFAPNVLVLPAGDYLGRVPPTQAADLVSQVLAGRRPGRHYRGRSSWPMPVQAAQHFAATSLGVDGLDALAPLRIESLEPHAWRVTLDSAADERPVVVEVREDLDTPPVRLTCHAERDSVAPAWRLLSLGHGPGRAAGRP